MLKRLFSLLIIAVLCLNALPLSAWYEPAQFAPAQFAPVAQPGVPYVFESLGGFITDDDVKVVDPQIPSDDDLLAPAADDYSSYPLFNSIDDAAKYYVDCQLNRMSNYSFRVSVHEVYDEKTSGDKFWEFYHKIRDKATEHNGVPYLGDYMLRQGMAREQVGHYVYYKDQSTGKYILTEYVYELTFIYLSNAEQEAQVGPAIENLIAELDLRNSHKSDYDKIKAVYDWMVNNIEYDFEHYNQIYVDQIIEWTDYPVMYSAYAGIVEKCCVCQGFAALFYRIMLTIGIDCRFTGGNSSAERSSGHSWNIVQVYGQYYLCDSTWDSNGRTYADQGGYPYPGHSWFLLGTNSRFAERVYDSASSVIMDTYPVSQCSYEAHDAARTSGKLAPTCTEAGATGSGVCPDCGVTLENFAVPSLGHDYDESGNCSRCGKVKPAYPLGDLDFDSDVNVRDGVVMQRVLSGLEADAELLESADLNLDGDVTVIDGVIMQRILAGLQVE